MDRMMAQNPLRAFIPDSFFSIFSEIAAAWISGDRSARAAVGTAILLAAAAFFTNILIGHDLLGDDWRVFVNIAGALAAFIFVGVIVYRTALRNAEAAAQIEAVEQRARDHPEQPMAAWDLARVKLESYLDRNLSQVSWIYFLVLVIMGVGFALIGVGIWHVYGSPETFGASIVAAVSGVVVQFIGATFLLIYKSTMAQARDYVTVLERINAVGMSIQILESIEGTEPQMRNDARSQLARDLLRMYGITTESVAATRRSRSGTERRQASAAD
jgi:hypothetical protein